MVASTRSRSKSTEEEESFQAVEDIPTLHDLYASEAIKKSEEEGEWKADEKLNKRVSIWRGKLSVSQLWEVELADII